MFIYSLPYSIPENVFNETEDDIIIKEFEIAPLIPGKKETYIYDDTIEYYKMYRKSKFGITTKKGGWDCLRHYEIIANKCIPYFSDIDKCPEKTMFNFPKTLIYEVNQKYDKNILSDDEYKKYLDQIFDYAKNNMTCRSVAQYLLNILIPKQSYENKKILLISGIIGYRNVNYTRELLTIGLRQILGNNFIDYPKINIVYKNCKDKEKYIGKGFTYGGVLEDDNINRENIDKRIVNKEFDIIIYGKVGSKFKRKNKKIVVDELNNLQYWNLVSKYYDKNEIIFIYGGDKQRNENDECLKMHSNYGICFVRELC